MAESMQAQSKGGPSPEIFGWFFVAAGLAFFLLGQALSIALILPARFFKQRKYYLFSFILACLACVCFPFGTILGVLTIIMLARPAVKEIYGRVSLLPVFQLQIGDVAEGNAHRGGFAAALCLMGVGVVKAATTVLLVNRVHGLL
jgi:hypothetical protein